MNKFTRIFVAITCVTMCYSMTLAETKSVTFTFNTAESLEEMGITVPTSTNKTSSLPSEIQKDDITLVPGSTPPHVTYYNNGYTFYSRSDDSFSFVGKNNATITNVSFNGMYAAQRFTADPTGFDSANTYWSGSANTVTFTGTGGNTLYSMTVTYEVQSTPTKRGDVNGDGVVSGADVTSLYSYLLDGVAVAGNADVNGDGVISGADVTALYEILLNGSGDELEAPTFSLPSGSVIYGWCDVTVTGPAGSYILYTTDGSEPTLTHYFNKALSPYNVTVGFTMTLKAVAVLDGKVSPVTTAYYTVLPDNNKNRNSLSSKYDADKYMYRLEWPHIKEDGNQTWLAKSEPEYGLALEMEWDNSKIANRFTCYYMDANNTQKNVSRNDTFKEDDELPYAYRSHFSDFSSSGYARGHLCPSADRLASEDQQALTYYLSNMQPQWQEHNGGQWMYLEGDVRKWAARCDTLYVVKAATIDDITLNEVTEAGTYSTTYEGTYYKDLKCKNRLPVAKYFYMALLAYNRSSNTYYAMGIWTKHYNDGTTGANGYDTFDWPVINSESAQYITIDELEQRTGLDFFCNLPDDIEDSVEATLNTTWWKNGAALNR